MIHPLRQAFLPSYSYALRLNLFSSLLVIFCFACLSPTLAQTTTLTTNTLPVTSICPGSDFEVSGTYQNVTGTFAVEFSSNGSSYSEIPSVVVSNSTQNRIITLRATIPASTPAGNTYRVRLVTKNPVFVGTPSSSILTVKAKPAPLTLDALILTCQRRIANDLSTSIYVTIQAGASAKLYNADLTPNSSQLVKTGDPTRMYFELLKPFPESSDSGYKYPVSEQTLYATQVVDGCESDRAPTLVRTLYTPVYGPTPNGLGIVNLCQGDNASPISQFHGPPPTNYSVEYGFNSTTTRTPPVPNTSVPNNTVYTMRSVPNDATKGCPNVNATLTFLSVKVNYRPSKPTVPASTITYCQFQQASSLTASTTIDGASLVWYGTDATGGIRSTVAPQPSTNTAGTFKYYVGQQLGNCDSERAEITVEVKAAAPAPTVSAVNYCQGLPANPLTAIAASGGSLNWYTAATGGTSSPNGPTPSTTTIGTINYYVSQTISGSCESQRIALPVTVNGIPSAPIVQNANVTLCQSTQAQPLTASGSNLKWYDVPSGGTASASITPVTNAVGTKSYYVSQSVGNCEGPRTAINVTVTAKPVSPSLESLILTCQRRIANDFSTPVYVKIQAGAMPKLYNSDLTPSPGILVITSDPTNVHFDLPKSYEPSDAGYKYPISEQTYYASQIVNGCESDKSPTLVRTLYRPLYGPTPVNPSSPFLGKIGYCQGDKALPLNEKGHSAPPENFYVDYSFGSTTTKTPPIPDTNVPGTLSYTMRSVPNDPTKGCATNNAGVTYLNVEVSARPTKPIVPTSTATFCQFQTGIPLSASTTIGGASLVWYGTNATGGSPEFSATKPSTDTPGTFKYYVAQKVNDCESERAEITVTVTPGPAAPSVTSAFSYCQKISASALTASGNGLRWYDESGKNIGSAPIPSTDSPGTTSYFVTQTAGGCESARAEIKVTTNPIPGAPGTSAISVCQNDPAPKLEANGTNLLWYSTETGVGGSSMTPTLNTSQPGQTIYYVSQSQESCEGPRASLVATVKGLPQAPGVTQRNLCQFAPSEPVVATSTGPLTWYNLDGSKFDSTPIINTDKGASFSFQVTQTVDGCASPKATLSVDVLTTPVPTVNKTTVELCLGSPPVSLEASASTGSVLKWTDPYGNVTTTAPTPPTLNATIKPEGDIYYVSQTGTNTCESSKVPIKVFVQTPPTMSILGTTTVNLGMEVPLKLSFTGVGPYRYKITNLSNLTSIKDTTILVMPERTTTYQVEEIANKCGVGLPGNGAVATITVTIPAIQTQAFTSTTLCAGSNLTTPFSTTGNFNPGSAFKLQLAKAEGDPTQATFVDAVNSQESNGQITGTISSSTVAGSYWVRVIATNPKIPINGSRSPSLLTIQAKATASMPSSQTIYEGQPAQLSVSFTGDGPWSFVYRDSTATGLGNPETVSTSMNPTKLDLRPTKTTAYLLTSVSNGCGAGTMSNRKATITVFPLLAVDDPSLADAVEIYPVPSSNTVTVHIQGLLSSQTAILELTDLTGQRVVRQETRLATSTLLLHQHPSGTYVLQIRVGDRTASKRIVKL
ncbi:Por secretion system C-terminal sorting domain-containing protein [Spirosoma endophyticum]|uniref:Por secretion system C-terminal sorting domain-containing protein n=2 Tax=Spirosoma endophyticum TaxID=662367 RepID=A0A1I2AU55_9BACT|nr:Por secretion system C-terminal sorting domain-containing protein [Spirosoma endophyticum]